MNLIKKLFSRMTITILLLIIEGICFGIVLIRFINYMPVISMISFVISILVVLGLVKRDETSAFKIAWIIVVMAIPFLGGILYLLFGTRHPTKRMRTKVENAHHEIAAHLGQCHKVMKAVKTEDERMHGVLQSILTSSAFPAYQKTSTQYYPFGELMYADMCKELKKAERYIFLEYFIIAGESDMWNGILEILQEKAEAGVDVRLIYDDMGSVDQFTIKHLIKLRNTNIKVIPFNPFVPALAVKMNNRDHRKIMVIDGHTAFNGGINIADEYINKIPRLGVWKDTGLMLKGEAVKSFTLMFLEIWNAFCRADERIDNIVFYENTGEICADDGFVMPYGDSPLDLEPLGENVYIEILNQAKRYVTIFTPYLIISDKMIRALQMAAKRGVDVRIITPGIPDKRIIYRVTRSYYRDLLKSGVKIYEYTPGFLHAKSFLCDDNLAVIGTINLDYRSLYLHFECATLCYKTNSIYALKEDCQQTVSECHQVTLQDCQKGFLSELFDALLHVFAPLL